MWPMYIQNFRTIHSHHLYNFLLYMKVYYKEVGFIPSHSIRCWSRCITTTKCKSHQQKKEEIIYVQIADLPEIVSRVKVRGMRRCLTPILISKLWVFFWECFQWEEDPDFFFLESHPLSYPNIHISANLWWFLETKRHEQYCSSISRLYCGVLWTLYKSTLLLP